MRSRLASFANWLRPNRPLEGGGAERRRLSKPLVYVEALDCFSETEIAERFNLLINRLRR
jgi:hypothetical protein